METQTRLSGYRGQAQFGGRNIQANLSPERYEAVFTRGAKDVPLTEEQQGRLDRRQAADAIAAAARAGEEVEISPLPVHRVAEARTRSELPLRVATEVMDIATPDATPRGLSVPTITTRGVTDEGARDTAEALGTLMRFEADADRDKRKKRSTNGGSKFARICGHNLLDKSGRSAIGRIHRTS